MTQVAVLFTVHTLLLRLKNPLHDVEVFFIFHSGEWWTREFFFFYFFYLLREIFLLLREVGRLHEIAGVSHRKRESWHLCIASGKKITEGIATNPVTESLGLSANTALSRDFGLRHSLLWNVAPKLCSWIIWSRTITHSLGKLGLYFVQ